MMTCQQGSWCFNNFICQITVSGKLVLKCELALQQIRFLCHSRELNLQSTVAGGQQRCALPVHHTPKYIPISSSLLCHIAQMFESVTWCKYCSWCAVPTACTLRSGFVLIGYHHVLSLAWKENL